ncbi:organic hydroperoxide resistance protein [Lichenibacterium ramalinae]|uniref:Organic hydroperoxide resistance protein n=1 Tax=Lichenibacterium ramalinae TaxID=2316527 RepID=A0A4Q2RJ56_9HYPH|nr:organic hydroperoxide resistance protein [Lichenibacterium ramalinae]RYB07105.1 organic hydroperoxide resistance protein [Lichenibacterium ramalinae]
MDILYTASATAVGGRQGRIRSLDGVLDHALAHPKELGGPGGEATNPEQLFAAGYAACFENALLRVARERKAPIQASSVTAHVGIGRGADGFFRLRATLEVSVPGRDRSEVEDLARIAHEEVCPYSRATRGNMDVEIRVVP